MFVVFNDGKILLVERIIVRAKNLFAIVDGVLVPLKGVQKVV